MSSNQSDGAVVTGAASGIGRAIAAGLAADGFSVVIADLDEVKGRAAAEEIAASHHGNCQVCGRGKRTSLTKAALGCGLKRGSRPTNKVLRWRFASPAVRRKAISAGVSSKPMV